MSHPAHQLLARAEPGDLAGEPGVGHVERDAVAVFKVDACPQRRVDAEQMVRVDREAVFVRLA